MEVFSQKKGKQGEKQFHKRRRQFLLLFSINKCVTKSPALVLPAGFFKQLKLALNETGGLQKAETSEKQLWMGVVNCKREKQSERQHHAAKFGIAWHE